MKITTKAIVLDFDGVVVRRSEFYKQEAWARVFVSYGEGYRLFFERAEREFGGGRGGDRFDILRETYRGLGEPEEKIPSLVDAGAKAFDGYVQAMIMEVGITDQDRQILEAFSRETPIYLNSATPTEALGRTIKNLKLEQFIAGALGRPKSKIENFRLVAEREKAIPQQIIFIGDNENDYGAAQEFGCRFVGFANDWNKWAGAKKPFAVITDLSELERYL